MLNANVLMCDAMVFFKIEKSYTKFPFFQKYEKKNVMGVFGINKHFN